MLNNNVVFGTRPFGESATRRYIPKTGENFPGDLVADENLFCFHAWKMNVWESGSVADWQKVAMG